MVVIAFGFRRTFNARTFPSAIVSPFIPSDKPQLHGAHQLQFHNAYMLLLRLDLTVT